MEKILARTPPQRRGGGKPYQRHTDVHTRYIRPATRFVAMFRVLQVIYAGFVVYVHQREGVLLFCFVEAVKMNQALLLQQMADGADEITHTNLPHVIIVKRYM